jgi:hypothetical protein
MTTVHVVKGPQRVDKTTFMIDKLFKKQVKYGPMSYLLLGSSGGFLRTVCGKSRCYIQH